MGSHFLIYQQNGIIREYKPVSVTLLPNELQMEPNQYKRQFLAMNKIENQSKVTLVTDMTPLIQNCLFSLFLFIFKSS